MPSFKHPSFQDRARQAAAEKNKALEQLRLRPEPDEEAVAQKKAAAERREAAQAERLAAKKAAAQSRAEAERKAAAPSLTEADRKAARDARYAARHARKKR